MRRSRPLTETHPELLVIETPGLSREYRVESRHLQRGLQQRRLSGLPWVDIFSMLLVGLLWPSVRSSNFTLSLGGSQHLLGKE